MVRSRARYILLIVFLVAAALIVTHPVWLRWMGRALVRNDPPVKSDIAVALAGDYYGRRVAKAAELVKAGYAPAVLVSGPPVYGVHESDLAIPMMVKKGYPAQWFIPLPNESLSTADEAQCVLRELQRRGVRRFLLVTSNFHTGRAARTYRDVEHAMGGGPEFRTIAATNPDFDPESWWRSRQGQKTFVIESLKAVAHFLGM